jgi:hypothetical protein
LMEPVLTECPSASYELGLRRASPPPLLAGGLAASGLRQQWWGGYEGAFEDDARVQSEAVPSPKLHQRDSRCVVNKCTEGSWMPIVFVYIIIMRAQNARLMVDK